MVINLSMFTLIMRALEFNPRQLPDDKTFYQCPEAELPRGSAEMKHKAFSIAYPTITFPTTNPNYMGWLNGKYEEYVEEEEKEEE